MDKLTLGPPRYYRPVCIKQPLGFFGGPSGYEEVSEADKDVGPKIIQGDTMTREVIIVPQTSSGTAVSSRRLLGKLSSLTIMIVVSCCLSGATLILVAIQEVRYQRAKAAIEDAAENLRDAFRDSFHR